MEHNHQNPSNPNTEHMPDYLKELYERRAQTSQKIAAAAMELTIANANYNALILENITLNGAIVAEERRLASQW